MLVAVGQRIPHQVLEDVFLGQECISFCHLQHIALFRELLQGIQVSIQFVVEATFQSTALTAQFCLIDRQVLVTRSVGIDRFEFSQPGAATEFTSAASDATDFSGFLTGPDLAHLYFDFEFVRVNFYEFSEINAVIGNVKEGRFSSVGLHLHLTDLHVQSELFGDGAAADHRFRLPGFVLFPEIDVPLTGATQDLLHVGLIFLYATLLHLKTYDLTGQGNLTQIKSVNAFHGHLITFFKRL